MKCPLCETSVKDTDQHCNCGEPLTPWRTIRHYGHTLRQRGLALASDGDYLGAALSFLEAALTNPLDDKSLIDAARALVPLDRSEDALRLLNHAASRPRVKPAATAVAQAIQTRAQQAAPNHKVETPQDKGPDGGASVTPEQPAVATDGEPARPFLGLAPIEKSSGWWGTKALDPIWKTVLHMEEEGRRDWRQEVPWLREALQGATGCAVFHYMLGLGAWQRNDLAAAKKSFVQCLNDDPPVLNPAAYYLCLHLEDEPKATAALSHLRRIYRDKDLDPCLEALGHRLAGWGEPALYQQFHALIPEGLGG